MHNERKCTKTLYQKIVIKAIIFQPQNRVSFFVKLILGSRYLIFKTLWPIFMNGVQLSQGYRATSGKQFTFYH